jgi:predicted HicB family RNase H-like nuclease
VKKQRKQMIFDINPELHMQIKIMAARRNVSLSLWVTRAIHEQLKKETRYDAISESETVQNNNTKE